MEFPGGVIPMGDEVLPPGGTISRSFPVRVVAGHPATPPTSRSWWSEAGSRCSSPRPRSGRSAPAPRRPSPPSLPSCRARSPRPRGPSSPPSRSSSSCATSVPSPFPTTGAPCSSPRARWWSSKTAWCPEGMRRLAWARPSSVPSRCDRRGKPRRQGDRLRTRRQRAGAAAVHQRRDRPGRTLRHHRSRLIPPSPFPHPAV